MGRRRAGTKKGDPIPPGWRHGDKLPSKRDVYSRTTIDLADFGITDLNFTEAFEGQTNGTAEGETSLDKRGKGQCCRFTWDCMTLYKSPEWKLGYLADEEREKKSWCCIGNYLGSCRNPYSGKTISGGYNFDDSFHWPPKCSNPWLTPEHDYPDK